MKRNEDKLFIVRSYIKAKNASDALRKFRKQEPDDVYVSDDWKEGKNKELSTAIGFDNGMTDEDRDTWLGSSGTRKDTSVRARCVFLENHSLT